MSRMHADRLVVHHHDDRLTVYEQVEYWPGRDCVTVWDADGNEIKHEDVLFTSVG